MRDNTNIEAFYDNEPSMEVEELVGSLHQIKHASRRYGYEKITKNLVAYLEETNRHVLERLSNMTARNQISFGLIRALFNKGTEIILTEDNGVLAGRVHSSEISSSMMGVYLDVTYNYISSTGTGYTMRRSRARIPYFRGVREISSLPIRPLNPEEKANLTKRGEMFRNLSNGAHYMHYTGHMEVKHWWSWDTMRAEGRVMIDPQSYTQFTDDNYSIRNDDDAFQELDDTQLWMTEPYVYGFSFVTKEWGRFLVDNISAIQFRERAFDQLVLDDDKKQMVKALVTNGAGQFTDIISGKGGGCIFLLHGAPGVGKTLTAEAIAELLHRPLYSVSVGELGTNVESLEKNLREILDVAQIWNAVILIDEADIFLEKRTSGDIQRNACVGVLLKLLEYHQGVLFLTTNRVTEFDTAFYSRISVALKYGELTENARGQIWANLLDAAGISGMDNEELAKLDLNGRQIKNTLRLAQSLAKQEGTMVHARHVLHVVNIGQQFMRDLETS
jgi:ATPase family associated with various cellular activities (AAA)